MSRILEQREEGKVQIFTFSFEKSQFNVSKKIEWINEWVNETNKFVKFSCHFFWYVLIDWYVDSDKEWHWTSLLDGSWINCNKNLQQEIRCLDIWNCWFVNSLKFIILNFQIHNSQFMTVWIVSTFFYFFICCFY
jgi:hypothetical protein